MCDLDRVSRFRDDAFAGSRASLELYPPLRVLPCQLEMVLAVADPDGGVFGFVPASS